MNSIVDRILQLTLLSRDKLATTRLLQSLLYRIAGDRLIGTHVGESHAGPHRAFQGLVEAAMQPHRFLPTTT
jgi:hypothetical protein